MNSTAFSIQEMYEFEGAPAFLVGRLDVCGLNYAYGGVGERLNPAVLKAEIAVLLSDTKSN